MAVCRGWHTTLWSEFNFCTSRREPCRGRGPIEHYRCATRAFTYPIAVSTQFQSRQHRAPPHVESVRGLFCAVVECKQQSTSQADEQVVNMPAFRHALATSGTNHRSDFYSPLLHYVILGNAARFSDAIVPGAAAYFAAQAASLVLYECEKPMLSTVRGLALLGSLQTVLAKEDMASLYFGMSLTVARESLHRNSSRSWAEGLGLHIDCSHLVASGKMTTEQKAARDDTFWSIFALDKWVFIPYVPDEPGSGRRRLVGEPHCSTTTSLLTRWTPSWIRGYGSLLLRQCPWHIPHKFRQSLHTRSH